MTRNGRLPLDRSSMAERSSSSMRGDTDAMADLPLPAVRGNLKTFAVEVNGAEDPETALSVLTGLASQLRLQSSPTQDEAILALWDSTGSFLVDASILVVPHIGSRSLGREVHAGRDRQLHGPGPLLVPVGASQSSS